MFSCTYARRISQLFVSVLANFIIIVKDILILQSTQCLKKRSTFCQLLIYFARTFIHKCLAYRK